jgi:hypothetical protein
MNDVVRDNKGRFIKGQSGNPLGKAKGIRNQMTLERVAFEQALRQYVADPARAMKLLKGIDRVLDVAINAEKDSDATAALKLMLDRVMPALPPQIGEEAEKLDSRLQITIQTNPNATSPVEVIIDGEATDITEVQ